MRLDIRYRCRFDYDVPIRESQNELRVAPVSDARQQLISYRVHTAPQSRVLPFTDYWGTRVDAFGVRELHSSLEVIADATVETRRTPLLAAAPRLDQIAAAEFRNEHLEYLERTAHTNWGASVTAEAVRQAELAGADVVSLVLAIHRRVGATLRYAPGSTYVGVEVEQVLAARVGVCQDYAHLAVAMCRSIGIPARYVSGYLFTTREGTGPSAADDAAEVVRVQTHAWFEAAIPGVGWLALDPTNAQEVGLRHVKIGHGRDYDDVTPLRGVFSGSADQQLEVVVDIRRLGSSNSTVDIEAARKKVQADARARREVALATQQAQAQQQ
jgi:transglutaminase-like putative cysteine protease